MVWLVTGARGMLGRDVVDAARARGRDVLALSHADLDICDAAAVRDAVGAPGVGAVVNCAAWTAVDAAETHEAQAFERNALGPSRLARAAREAGVRLVHVSTDYVFDGRAASPYRANEPLRPLGAYGRTKAAGEWAVRAEGADALIVRTAWLYGAGGSCFPKTIARLLAARDHLDVVDDQVGQPTWSADVARLIVDLLERRAPGGVYHATASGRCSWWAFARAVASARGVDPARVRRTTSAAFPRPAPRPGYSVLDHADLARAGVAPIGPWRERWERAAPLVLAGERA